jgi:hypothetical protein
MILASFWRSLLRVYAPGQAGAVVRRLRSALISRSNAHQKNRLVRKRLKSYDVSAHAMFFLSAYLVKQLGRLQP